MNKIPPLLAHLLNDKVRQYKSSAFILNDPICIPHQFSQAQDIEIAAFLTALISWGNRTSIIQAAQKLMQILQPTPYLFVMNYSPADNKLLKNFYYRTFQPYDILFYIKTLHRFYYTYKSLEVLFHGTNILQGIQNLRDELLCTPHQKRVEKHLPNTKKGSAAKRINMFLRWMVRKDEIDFGLWKSIQPSELLIPLDTHTSCTAYLLGLLPNTKAHLNNVLHLTNLLKTLDAQDPIKYDFALFGMGIYEKKTSVMKFKNTNPYIVITCPRTTPQSFDNLGKKSDFVHNNLQDF